MERALPAIVRPAFTLGGTGGGIARSRAVLEARVESGLRASPARQVLVDARRRLYQILADGQDEEDER